MSDESAEETIMRSQSSEESIVMRVTGERDRRESLAIKQEERISSVEMTSAAEDDDAEDRSKAGLDTKDGSQDVQLMVTTEASSPCSECRSRSKTKTTTLC